MTSLIRPGVTVMRYLILLGEYFAMVASAAMLLVETVVLWRGEADLEHEGLRLVASFHLLLALSGSRWVAEVGYEALAHGRLGAVLLLLLVSRAAVQVVGPSLLWADLLVAVLHWAGSWCPRTRSAIAAIMSGMGPLVEILPDHILLALGFQAIYELSEFGMCRCRCRCSEVCFLTPVLTTDSMWLLLFPAMTDLVPWASFSPAKFFDFLAAIRRVLLVGEAGPLLRQLLAAFVPWEPFTVGSSIPKNTISCSFPSKMGLIISFCSLFSGSLATIEVLLLLRGHDRLLRPPGEHHHAVLLPLLPLLPAALPGIHRDQGNRRKEFR